MVLAKEAALSFQCLWKRYKNKDKQESEHSNKLSLIKLQLKTIVNLIKEFRNNKLIIQTYNCYRILVIYKKLILKTFMMKSNLRVKVVY